MPKVSIIIPVYNVEKYLRECLDTVVNQTLKDIEIICVNDGSTDGSLAILKEYAGNDTRIKIINLEKNGGLGNARNVALSEVTSDYVMFLDSDDWLELNACETAYNQISKNNNDFAIFSLYQFYEKNNHKERINFKIRPFISFVGKESFYIDDVKAPCLANCECWYKIFRKEFLLKNSIYFDRGAFEDQTFNCKIYALANSISVIDVPLYNYRVRKGSITGNFNNFKDYLNAKKRAFEYIETIKNSDRKNKLLSYWTISTSELVLVYFKKYTRNNKSIAKEYYSLLREFFVYMSKFGLDKVKSEIDYSRINFIIENKSYNSYRLFSFVSGIFSVKDVRNYKVITVLGITLKIKK